MDAEVIPLDPRLIVAAVATVISAISLGIAIYAGWRTRNASKTSIAIAEFNAAQSHRTQIRNWASDSLSIVGEALTEISHSSDKLNWPRQRLTILSKLTTEIDKGRWLLPNREHERYGKDKESAYTGLRQPPLDYLTRVYGQVTILVDLPLTPKSNEAEVILRCKRQFVSAIQEKLEPRLVDEELTVLSKASK